MSETNSRQALDPKAARMGTAPLLPLIFKMSLPSMFSMLIQALYNIVDSIFVAKVGETALSAVSLVYPIQMLCISVGVGTAIGVASLVSRKLGAQRQDIAQEVASHGIFLALCSGLVFLIFGLFFADDFVNAFSDNEALIQPAASYCTITSSFAVFSFVSILCERLMQGSGDTVTPMFTSLSGCITNIILDPIMIFGYFGIPAMGVKGAAIATVIGQVVSMTVNLIVVNKKQFAVKATIKGLKVSGPIVRQIYEVGFPAMVMQAITSVLNIFMNAILIGFSETAVAVLGVYFKVQSFVFLPVFGMNQGLMPIIAFNYGAKNRDRMMKAMKIGMIIAFLFMSLCTVLFQAIPAQIMSLFDAQGELMTIGCRALKTISFNFPFAAIGILIGTIFQSTGHGFYSMITSILRQLVLILPLAKLFSALWGLEGVWWSYPISEVLSLVFVLIVFKRLWNKELQYIGQEQK